MVRPERMRAMVCLLCVLTFGSYLPAHADEIFKGAQPFFQENCEDCHNPDDKAGRLDLTTLAYHPEDAANFLLWVKIHDRVQAGEMPPKKKKARPDPAKLKSFVKGMDTMLTASEKTLMDGEGRSMKRRLNRYEYEDALRDLLNLPWLEVKDRLPQDGEAYRFNKSGEALDISHVQMSRYLSVADFALRQAMTADYERPADHTNRYYARDEFGLRNFTPRENGTLPDRLSFPVLDSKAQPDVRAGRAPITSPATREREAIGKVVSTFSDAGGTVGQVFAHRWAASISCASPVIPSGWVAAGSGAGFMKDRATRRRRYIICRCIIVRIWTKSGLAAATNRSVCTLHPPARNARWLLSTSSRNPRPTKWRSHSIPVKRFKRTARACSARA